MSLSAVRRWCRTEGITAGQFRAAVRASLRTAMSLLLDSIRREFPAVVDVRVGSAGYRLTIGKDWGIEADMRGSLLFPPLLLTGDPRERGSDRTLDQPRRAIRAVAAALNAGGPILDGDTLETLFLNSLANLTLNRLIAERGLSDAAPEPAWQGHCYFPFPALRAGPTADDVKRFCNLIVPEDRIVLAACDGVVMHTAARIATASWNPAWSPGTAIPPGLIPIHPWTLKRSETIARLIAGGWLRLTHHRLDAQPLASQRTCAIAGGGHHIKLALDATLTGELRLLYGLNVTNAPVVSAMAERRLGALGPWLNFQTDVASFSHAVEGIGPYLSSIVRAPPRACPGETLHTAIDLWTGRQGAQALFGINGPDSAEQLMHDYARALLTGPVLAWTSHGFGFEPHIQNTLVRVRDGVPVGVMLRDLDATILNPALARLDEDRAGILSRTTWQNMPDAELGGLRLAHALHLGHLAIVANMLHRRCGARYRRLDDAIQSAWQHVLGLAGTADRPSADAVRRAATRVKRSLSMAVSRSMTMTFGA